MRVHYYRAGSAASRMRFDELDVEYLLSGEILHLTGITAALSESCHDLIDRLISVANERGVTVSFDVNVRRMLLEGAGPAGGTGSSRRPRRPPVSLGRRGRAPVRRQRSGTRPREAAGSAGRDGGRPRRGRGLRGGGSWRLREGRPTPWKWWTQSERATPSSPAFLSGRLRGWSTEECLDMANACGACAVTVPGDLKGLPNGRGGTRAAARPGSQDAGR